MRSMTDEGESRRQWFTLISPHPADATSAFPLARVLRRLAA